MAYINGKAVLFSPQIHITENNVYLNEYETQTVGEFVELPGACGGVKKITITGDVGVAVYLDKDKTILAGAIGLSHGYYFVIENGRTFHLMPDGVLPDPEAEQEMPEEVTAYMETECTGVFVELSRGTGVTVTAEYYSDMDFEAYDAGVKAGKQSAYDEFWDAFQENGNRKTYNYSFNGWTDEYYAPKYPIVIDYDGNVGTTYNSSKITNTKVPITVSCQTLITMFSNSVPLVTIPHLNVTGVTKLFDRCFSSCKRLENLTMVGSINANGFNVSDCEKLTKESLLSVLNALADKTTDTSGTQFVCTLGGTNLNKLTNAEKAVATEKGWTLA